MIIESSRIVSPLNGPRPAGKPDECFYCHQKIGDEHKEDCVCFQRIVMIEARITMPRVIPASWTADSIEFQLNNGSWCADNIVDDLNKLREKNEVAGCLCPHFI